MRVHRPRAALILLACLAIGCTDADAPSSSKWEHWTQWPSWAGDPGSSRYSALDQITKANVAELEGDAKRRELLALGGPLFQA